MGNLWLLFLVGLSMGFFSSKSCVNCQSFSTVDDLYIEGQPSGDLPVDDEDGEDDGSGSGSGDYENEDVLKRILNVPQTTASKEMLPFQTQPTTDSPNTSPTTEETSQDKVLQTTSSNTNVFFEPSEELMTRETYSSFDPTSPAPRHIPASETSAADLNEVNKNGNRNLDNEIVAKKFENDVAAEKDQFRNMEVTSENLWERTEVLAAVIACGVVGFLCAVFLLLLLAYRMKKKDEGSYDLGDTKLSTTGYHKAPTKEFYA